MKTRLTLLILALALLLLTSINQPPDLSMLVSGNVLVAFGALLGIARRQHTKATAQIGLGVSLAFFLPQFASSSYNTWPSWMAAIFWFGGLLGLVLACCGIWGLLQTRRAARQETPPNEQPQEPPRPGAWLD